VSSRNHIGYWGKAAFFAWLENYGYAGAGAFLMIVLSYLTDAAKQYAPFSYGIVGLLVFVLIRICLKITSTRKQTSEDTYVKYQVNQGGINLCDKSNIWGEPSVQVNMVQNSPADLMVSLHVNGQPKQAIFFVVFDVPIEDRCLLLSVIPKESTLCPVKTCSSINSRVANIVLTNIPPDCSFEIWFTKKSQ